MTHQPPSSSSQRFTRAYQTLTQELTALERMVEVFSYIFELEVAEQAKNVRDQLVGISGFYSWETWGTEDGWLALDQGFAELKQSTGELVEHIDRLERSVGELNRVYKEHVLPQAMVILVGSLEIYLSTMFTMCLSVRSNLGESAISEIRSRYNFQNWGSTVKAYHTFLDIELGSETVDRSEVHTLLQKRHVIVHQMGIIDERAIRELKLPSSAVGERLKIDRSDVLGGIDLVRSIGKLVYDLSQQTTPQQGS